jgi:hypothetical protein
VGLSQFRSCTFASSLTEPVRYVDDILKSTARSVGQVTIESNGNWSLGVREGLLGKTHLAVRATGIRMATKIRIFQHCLVYQCWKRKRRQHTHPGRNPQARPQRSSHVKRPISAAIDPTLSSDDGEPTRTPKRQLTQSMSHPFVDPFRSPLLDQMPPLNNDSSYSIPNGAGSHISSYGYGI